MSNITNEYHRDRKEKIMAIYAADFSFGLAPNKGVEVFESRQIRGQTRGLCWFGSPIIDHASGTTQGSAGKVISACHDYCDDLSAS